MKEALESVDADKVQRVRSIWNLNDDTDYVRQIDYSNQGILYSIAENGFVRQWDV